MVNSKLKYCNTSYNSYEPGCPTRNPTTWQIYNSDLRRVIITTSYLLLTAPSSVKFPPMHKLQLLKLEHKMSSTFSIPIYTVPSKLWLYKWQCQSTTHIRLLPEPRLLSGSLTRPNLQVMSSLYLRGESLGGLDAEYSTEVQLTDYVKRTKRSVRGQSMGGVDGTVWYVGIVSR